MRKSYRVKTEKDFSLIFDQGKSVANRKFVVYFLVKDQAHFRVGLSVSKKLGNAVVRNGIKRQFRHLLQEFSPYLLAYDFVVIARKGAEELNHQDFKQNLRHVLKLAGLYQEGNNHEEKTNV
ncbi:ribonuclease P protein component [Streptococcus sp. sy018]|uniref:ribonuclease P protein component n=1 Tax=Streptococcus sp. sy018 TaxID=2600147 RepID=UPI0011B67FED|nr:ribonuclease P protein component [Streptococcus sp. sy018]TWS94586.1 ribonuclease P protein component [Streptococcus sp. sy018]